jgi:hypothetical protein
MAGSGKSMSIESRLQVRRSGQAEVVIPSPDGLRPESAPRRLCQAGHSTLRTSTLYDSYDPARAALDDVVPVSDQHDLAVADARDQALQRRRAVY